MDNENYFYQTSTNLLEDHKFNESDMHSMSLDELKKLHRRVEAKCHDLQGELSDLAFHNYRTYVDVSTTAEYCREKFSQMDLLMRQSSSSFPNLQEKIDQFKSQSSKLLNEFKLLSELMEKCIRAGHFDQAYSITNFALSIKQSKLVQYPLFKNVVDYLLEARHSFLDELFNKFNGPLNLAHSIQVFLLQFYLIVFLFYVINNIRKIPYISKTQLRISILQYRDIYLEKKVSTIMSEPDFSLRVIEIYRECMYDTIILYLAVFPDSDTQQRHISLNEDTRWERWTGSSQNYLLQCWAQRNIERLLSHVQCSEYKSLLDIEMMISKLMSCAFSFGRMGLDFRALVHFKFSQMVFNIFQSKIEAATKSFTSHEKIDLIDYGIFENTQNELKKEIGHIDLSAPLELCIWDDLCIFGNSIIDALNEIRHSIYINSIRRVYNILQFSFQSVFAWLDTFLTNSDNISIVKKAAFFLIKQFLPFINNCFFSCFPFEQCARKYFSVGNCSLEEYNNAFSLTNSNIFGLCRNESLLFEMKKEFDLKEIEEQKFSIEKESLDVKEEVEEKVVENEGKEEED
ncbi:hypothetical protein Mgra_00002591 [Meloidogyne graminicola]|uniref:Conserved oligomeric Golgi complex subunit 8 n=1 Tax=Meloidogyne graminicola TaxID=189291 RepID=A0A8S9ZWA3_9BILA|nr:hypothetical protein Mgra_00002591 [Meloidogyne graminicola]